MSGPRFNRRMVLEAPVASPDGSGGLLRGWNALGSLWVSMDGRSGRERKQGGATVSQGRYRITVRAAPFGSLQRPTPAQRLREGGRVFLIRAVVEDEADGRYLTCFADEEVAA
ncbi:MAG: head-tail adaptor protein [Paracoccaceae bacterium]